MNILKLTDKPPELEAVKDKVVEELQYLRSLDTAGDGGLSLFLYVLNQHLQLALSMHGCYGLNVCFCFRHQCDQEPDKQSYVCEESV